MTDLINQVKARELRTESPFKDLFPVDKAMVETLCVSMMNGGFLAAYPLVVWHGVVVDGHTRLAAARRAGLGYIPCCYMEFKDEDAAIAFAINSQRNRRNLSAADIRRCVATLDKRQAHGGDRKREIKTPEGALIEPAPVVRSSRVTGKLLGISPRQVERTRTINDHGDASLKEAVDKGEKTITTAYNEIQEARKPLPLSPAAELTFAFEVCLCRTIRASSLASAKKQFAAWYRTSPQSETLRYVEAEKALVIGEANGGIDE